MYQLENEMINCNEIIFFVLCGRNYKTFKPLINIDTRVLLRYKQANTNAGLD